ncbi:MAG: glycosyltransferase family 1 protein [Acidobacteriota bacterium]
MRVAMFTDNDFDRVNGVTTTLRAVARHAPHPWAPRIYTAADTAVDLPDYFSASSVGIGLPWCGDMRIYWPRIRRFARELHRDGVSVIHITTPGPVGLVARWLGLHMRLPMIGSYHAHLGEYVEGLSGARRLGRMMNEYMRWFYGPCRSLLVPSRATAQMLTEAGYRPDRLRLWPRGVESAQFTPDRASATLRRRWGVDDGRPAILYAGRLSAEKGLALVAPLQRVLHRHGIKHRFVFVGDGPMARSLRNDCPDAIFLGNLVHDNVAVAMASADVFLFPSATDAFGNVVLESQACGIPALVSDRGGPSEHVTHGVTGYVCRAGSVDEFGSRLVELLRSPRRRRAMGTLARAAAELRSWPIALRPLCEAWRFAMHQDIGPQPADPCAGRPRAAIDAADLQDVAS